MRNGYFVYILTTRKNTVLYTGVTRDWSRRIWEHKQRLVDGFTKKYSVNKLVYRGISGCRGGHTQGKMYKGMAPGMEN